MEVDEIVVPDNSETKEVPRTAEDYMGYSPEVFESIKEKVEETSDPKEDTPDITEVINKTLKEIQVDDKGKFIYPEGISPELKAAIAATKSFRDTQSSYTKTQQELKALQAEAEALREQVAKYETPTAGLSQEEQAELAELKYTNPDEWYKRMRALEAQATEKVEEKFKEVREKAKAKTAEEQRVEALEKFNSTVEHPLTPDELVANTPPIWQDKVIAGEMSMEDYLQKAYDFIHADKVVNTPKAPETTNLNSAPGGDKDPQLEEGIDYSKITF